MKVRDVMTKNPVCCTPEMSLEAVACMMRDCDCGAIPVVGDAQGRIPIGVITDRDIVVRALAAGRDPSQLAVRDCMTMPAITVTDDVDLDACIDLLEEHQLRRAVVIDSAGRCVGIVAQADIALHASKRKAGELLGEVSRPAPNGAGVHAP
jgi:CBS domain-containing protein